MEPEEMTKRLEKTGDDLREYINLRLEYLQLSLTEKLIFIVSRLALIILLVSFGFFFILFLSFSFAYYYSAVAKDAGTGFVIISGFYLLIGIILIILRKKLIFNPLANILTSAIFENDEKKQSHE